MSPQQFSNITVLIIPLFATAFFAGASAAEDLAFTALSFSLLSGASAALLLTRVDKGSR